MLGVMTHRSLMSAAWAHALGILLPLAVMSDNAWLPAPEPTPTNDPPAGGHAGTAPVHSTN